MLQQNFQTPEALGLTAPQHRALVLTLNALERGELRHAPLQGSGLLGRFSFESPYTGHFNMSTFQTTNSCGTVCCIAGTAELLGDTVFVGLDRTPELEELFMPNLKPNTYDKVTPDQAAIALRSYLTTGVPDWSHVA